MQTTLAEVIGTINKIKKDLTKAGYITLLMAIKTHIDNEIVSTLLGKEE